MNWLATQTHHVHHSGVNDWYMNPGPHEGNGQRDTKVCRRSTATLSALALAAHSASFAYQFIVLIEISPLSCAPSDLCVLAVLSQRQNNECFS